MTGKGVLTSQPKRKLRLMLVAHLVWLGLVCILGSWWGVLLLKKAARIAELEQQIGGTGFQASEYWARTQRMVIGEASAMFLLLIASSAFLMWLYWRDLNRNKSIQAFFASLTHELRTPLTSIRLQAESIADALPAEAGQNGRALVERLLEDTARLESQVERTLELARIEGGGPIYTRPIAIKSVLDRTVRQFQESSPGKIVFEQNLGDQHADWLIQADPASINVILRNLFENAIRHSEQDQIVLKFDARAVAQGPDSPFIALRIQDNGKGFSGDSRSLGKIFQKGSKSQGAGVGLYLIRALMERMGGAAMFSSGPGFVTELWFRKASSDV